MNFSGPDCGVNRCIREVGHIGDHRTLRREARSDVVLGLMWVAMAAGVAFYTIQGRPLNPVFAFGLIGCLVLNGYLIVTGRY